MRLGWPGNEAGMVWDEATQHCPSVLPCSLLRSVVLSRCTVDGLPVLLEPPEGIVLLHVRQPLVRTDQEGFMFEWKLGGRREQPVTWGRGILS